MKVKVTNTFLLALAFISAATHSFARMPPLSKSQARIIAYRFLDEVANNVNADSALYPGVDVLWALGYDQRLFDFWKDVIEKSTTPRNAATATENLHYMIWAVKDSRLPAERQRATEIGLFLSKTLKHQDAAVRARAVCEIGLLEDPFEAMGFAEFQRDWPQSLDDCQIYSYGDKEWTIRSLIEITTSTAPTSERVRAVKALYGLFSSYINGTFPTDSTMRRNRVSLEDAMGDLARDKDDEVAFHALRLFLVYQKHLPNAKSRDLLVEFLNRPLSPDDDPKRKDLFVWAIRIAMDEDKPTGGMPEARAAIKMATTRGRLLDFYNGLISKEYPSVQESHAHIIRRWEKMLE